MPACQLANRNGFICAVGTGSCFLAEAGILNGRAATTHWYYIKQFQRDYPAVLLQKHHLVTRAGNLFCAGSVNSVADLMIHFVEILYSQAIAKQVESHFSPEIRQSLDLNFYHQGHPDEDIARAQQWLQANYAQSVRLKALAEEVEMSVRTLNRRFQTATGQTPIKYLQTVRIGVARDLIRNSNLAIADIAYRVGYHNASHFSADFRKAMNVSPAHYRQNVRSKLFSV
jgi:transcriptional regulator GlxA family with amidase domain